MSWKNWTEWRPFTKALEELPTSPGVYVLSVARFIFRMGGSDPDGILDIGQSTNLQHRLSKFNKCALGEQKRGHAAGCRFQDFRLARWVPLENVRMRWRRCDSQAVAVRIEAKRLLRYLDKYGELPPWNHALGKKEIQAIRRQEIKAPR